MFMTKVICAFAAAALCCAVPTYGQSAGQCVAPLLAAAESLPGGVGSSSLHAADLNGDGLMDLAAGNGSASGKVSVRFGLPSGGFAPEVLFTAGIQPDSILIADLDRDGDLDIAVANRSAATVSLLKNDGAGTFSTAIDFAVGKRPEDLATGDFNEDGRPDLAVANGDDDTLSILLGHETSAFIAGGTIAVDNNPISVTAGDFDGDGHADLASANADGETLQILRGDGSGGFSVAATYDSLGFGLNFVRTVDLNLDGRDDLLAIDSGQTSRLWLLTATAAGLAAPVAFTVPGNASFVEVADIDVDGRLDLVVANPGHHGVSILYGNGSSFDPAVEISASPAPESLATVDSDHDGITDIVVANSALQGLVLLRGRGTRVFQSSRRFPTVTQPFAGTSADLDGDGIFDLIIAGRNVDKIAVHRGLSGGAFSSATLYDVGNGPKTVIAGEFSGDGIIDLVTLNDIDRTISVLRGDGSGSFGIRADFAAGGAPNQMVAIDSDGDNDLDLALSGGDASVVTILAGDGAGGFATPVTHSLTHATRAIAAGDVNVDGHPDLAAVGTGRASILLGDGAGGFSTSSMVGTWGFPTHSILGDVNGDTFPDLLIADSATVSLLTGNGDGTFDAAMTIDAGEAAYDLSLSDLDDDGDLDLVVGNSNLSLNAGDRAENVAVLLNDGTGTFGPAAFFAAGDNPWSIVTRDFDGNGRQDVAVVNGFSNDVTLIFNTCEAAPEPSDVTPPIITAPTDVVIGNDPGQASAFVGDAALGAATATDDIGVTSITRSGVPAGNVFPVGETTILYTALDASGNSATAQQQVIVLDNERPVLTVPGDITVEAVGTLTFVSDAVLGMATADDNVGVVTITRSGVPAGNLFALGTTTMTYRAIDAAGNTAIGEQHVIVRDTIAPLITIAAPQSIAYGLNQVVPAHFTCTDAVSGVASCAGTVTDGAAIDTATVGVKTFTVTAADAAGNATFRSVSYSVGFFACRLYDSDRAVHSGAIVSIKFQLCDGSGNNVSSAATIVHALHVATITGDATSAVEGAGNSTSDNNFRFDPAVGGTGGYIFTLKTRGFRTGTYVLVYQAGADPTIHATELVFHVR